MPIVCCSERLSQVLAEAPVKFPATLSEQRGPLASHLRPSARARLFPLLSFFEYTSGGCAVTIERQGLTSLPQRWLLWWLGPCRAEPLPPGTRPPRAYPLAPPSGHGPAGCWLVPLIGGEEGSKPLSLG